MYGQIYVKIKKKTIYANVYVYVALPDPKLASYERFKYSYTPLIVYQTVSLITCTQRLDGSYDLTVDICVWMYEYKMKNCVFAQTSPWDHINNYSSSQSQC